LAEPYWLFEAGLGEQRAALVTDGTIIEAHVERAHDGCPVGTIASARLLPRDAHGLAIAALDDGSEAIVSNVPRSIAEGAALRIEITRTAIPEQGLVKRAKARIAADDRPIGLGPSLLDRIAATPHAIRTLRSIDDDALEAAGWSELIEQADSGIVPLPHGLLRVALTPALTVVDVDGPAGQAETLATSAVRHVAAHIRRMGIGGGIVVDLPTLPDKAARVRVADAFDTSMTSAFERTAINGFGLLHIVCPRLRPSLPERLAFRPAESAAIALLRRAQRAHRIGSITLAAHPAVIGWIEQHSALVTDLARETACTIHLRAEPQRAMAAGDVH
jgi:hypothetical protein